MSINKENLCGETFVIKLKHNKSIDVVLISDNLRRSHKPKLPSCVLFKADLNNNVPL